MCYLREDEAVVHGPILDQVASVPHENCPHDVLKPLCEPKKDSS